MRFLIGVAVAWLLLGHAHEQGFAEGVEAERRAMDCAVASDKTDMAIVKCFIDAGVPIPDDL